MPDRSTRCVHGFVTGAVQGVGYRASMQREAAALGLAGWVRNVPDGRVEFLAQGPAEALERLVAWAAKGPSRARVGEVSVAERPVGEGLDPFRVRP